MDRLFLAPDNCSVRRACGSWPVSWGPDARWSSYRTMWSRELRTCWRGGHRRRCGQCSSARDRNLRASPANGFRTRPCCLSSAAMFCTFARFSPAGGPVQTANWRQRPTGTSTALTEPYARDDADTEVLNCDFDGRLAASLLPERIHPSRRRTLNEATWRNHHTVEKPGREEAVPDFDAH